MSEGEKQLRDEFAKAALTGMLMCCYTGNMTPDEFATEAYKQADAMLKARKP